MEQEERRMLHSDQDLNPIEKCHFLIQIELDKLLAKYRARNKRGLLRLVQRAWKQVPNRVVLKTYYSFLVTCLKAHEAKGLNNFRE